MPQIDLKGEEAISLAFMLTAREFQLIPAHGQSDVSLMQMGGKHISTGGEEITHCVT